MFERTCEQCLPNLCFHRNHIIRCSLIEQIEELAVFKVIIG